MGFTIRLAQPLLDTPLRGILFHISLDLPNNELLLNVRGNLLGSDEKLIAILQQSTSAHENKYNEGMNHGRVAIPLLVDNAYRREQNGYSLQMIATFDERTVEFIENQRNNNKKRDVTFVLKLTAMTVDPSIRIMNNISVMNANIQSRPTNILKHLGGDSREDSGLRILNVDNNNGMQIMLYSSGPVKHTIPASDWVSEFQLSLGLGNHLIVESELPDSRIIESKDFKETEHAILAERLENSFELLKEMQEKLNEGEWGEVIENSVKLFESVKRDNGKVIRELVSESTGLSEEKSGKLSEALDKLYSYSADLHHPVDKETKGVKEPFTGSKEDAYMIYLLSVSLVNLLSKKLSRKYHK